MQKISKRKKVKDKNDANDYDIFPGHFCKAKNYIGYRFLLYNPI